MSRRFYYQGINVDVESVIDSETIPDEEVYDNEFNLLR
jgi:hypothetical protein